MRDLKPEELKQLQAVCDEFSEKVRNSEIEYEVAMAEIRRIIGQKREIKANESLVAIDPIVKVDRKKALNYPADSTLLHPELQGLGPGDYEITKLCKWASREFVKNGKQIGLEFIYREMEDANLLQICFDLADLEAIKEKGIRFFRMNFAGKCVHAFRSVLTTGTGHDFQMLTPTLEEKDGKLVIVWQDLKRSIFTEEDIIIIFMSAHDPI